MTKSLPTEDVDRLRERPLNHERTQRAPDEQLYLITAAQVQQLIDTLNALSAAQGIRWQDVNPAITILVNDVRGRAVSPSKKGQS